MEFSLILAIAAGIGIVSMLSSSQTAGTWKAAARELGVGYQKKNAMTPPKIEGPVDGMHLTIEVRGSGNSRATRYRVQYPSLDLGLQVTKKTGMSRISEFLGAQDAETGDLSFDEEFTVKTSNPDRMATVLTPSVRQAVRDLLAALPAAKITDDHIDFSRRAVERKLDRMLQTAQRLIATGNTLMRGEHPAAKRMDSHFDQPPVLLAPDPFAPSEALDLPPVVFPIELPAIPETYLETEADDYMMPPMSIGEGLSESVPDTPTIGKGPGPLEVADALFGGRQLSFQMTAIFDERFAGQPVRWSGTVTEQAETGVVVDVGSLDTNLYGPMAVKAIVPTKGNFQPGDAVTVTGTLSGIDAFDRTITVDGDLEKL